MHARDGSRTRSALLGLVATAAALLLAEGVVRAVLEPPGRVPARGEDALLMAHPVRGYALVPGSTSWHPPGNTASRIDINERGFRDGPFAAAASADLRLLAVGDSFTLGLAVDAASPWPEQLERLLQRDSGQTVAVFNAGVMGYSDRQMRQVVEELLPELRPQLVLAGVVPENWSRVEDPFLYLGGQLIRGSGVGGIVVTPRGNFYSPIVRPWLRNLDIWLNQHWLTGAHVLALVYRLGKAVTAPAVPGPGMAVTDSPVPDTAALERMLAPSLAEIGAIQDATRARGAELVVLLVNPQRVDGSFAPVQSAYNAVVDRYCQAQGIPVVDPLPALAAAAGGRLLFRTPDDYHWTEAAHRVAAEALRDELINELKPGPLSDPGQ